MPAPASLLQAALGRIRAGDARGALGPLGEALAADPEDARAWFATGLALGAVGEAARSEDALRQACRLAPGWAEPWAELGTRLAWRGVRDEPVACWRAALAADPGHLDARVRLANALVSAGQLGEAEELLRGALARAPVHGAARSALARLLQRQGAHAAAWELIEAGGADDPHLAVAAAALAPRIGRSADALARVDGALARAEGAARVLLLHARGDLCDALDRPDEAFEAWRAANERRGLRFDAAAHRRAVASLVARTPAAAPLPPIPEAERPVLIVGVPRTGSTLLEQALSRHPGVAAGGELEALRDAAAAAPRPPEQDWAYALPRLLAGDAAPLRARYLAALDAVSVSALRVTDKMPNNLLHLGFLGAILPGARVIRCRRDPSDTAFSCFRQAFGAGLPWATTLPGIAAWIETAERLLDHWQATAPLRFHEVAYEELVARPAEVLAGVCAFLDLPFDPAVCAPERARRVAATASAIEVQDPIHVGSVGRSARYAAAMAAHGWPGVRPAGDGDDPPMTPLALALLLSACSGGSPGGSDSAPACDAGETELDAACACSDAGVEIGGGATAFESVADGDPVTMVHGPQGGWHVLGSARFANFLPIVAIHYTITVESTGAVVSDNLYRVQMVDDGACSGFYPGMYGYLDVGDLASGEADTPPELLADLPLLLRMEVSDTEGRTATDELHAIAALDPMDEPDTP